ncbi:hypothetical protein NPIL_145451 [Nephila pilipes]|uniref:Uncharacterized protein n=1 Tax=Nephila pilipes TaxID=299642 RepID=A0A8X6TPK9_NEPPI|nr:hypothetical protein NPIL_145451 [Nephila pilipes]
MKYVTDTRTSTITVASVTAPRNALYEPVGTWDWDALVKQVGDWYGKGVSNYCSHSIFVLLGIKSSIVNPSCLFKHLDW